MKSEEKAELKNIDHDIRKSYYLYDHDTKCVINEIALAPFEIKEKGPYISGNKQWFTLEELDYEAFVKWENSK